MAFFSGWLGSNDNDNEIIEEEETEDFQQIDDVEVAILDSLKEQYKNNPAKLENEDCELLEELLDKKYLNDEKNIANGIYRQQPVGRFEQSLRNAHNEDYGLEVEEAETKKSWFW